MQRSERSRDCRKAQVHGSFRIFEKSIKDLRNQPDERKVAPANLAVHKIETERNGISSCDILTSEKRSESNCNKTESKAVLCSATDTEEASQKTESDKERAVDLVCCCSLVKNVEFMTENKENIHSEVSNEKKMDFNICEQKERSDAMELKTVSKTILCTKGDNCKQNKCLIDSNTKHTAQEKVLELSLVNSEIHDTDSQEVKRHDKITVKCMKDTVLESSNSAQAALQIPRVEEPELRNEVSRKSCDTHSKPKRDVETSDVQQCNVNGSKEDSKQKLKSMEILTAKKTTESGGELNHVNKTLLRPFVRKRDKTSNTNNNSDKIAHIVKEKNLTCNQKKSVKTESRKDTKHIKSKCDSDHILDSSGHRQKLKESEDSRHRTKKREKKRNEHCMRSSKKESSTRLKEVGHKNNTSSHHEKSVYESLIKAKKKAIDKEIKSKAVELDSLSVYESTVVVDDTAKSSKPREERQTKSPYKQYITVRSMKEEQCEELRRYVKCARERSDKDPRKSPMSLFADVRDHVKKMHSTEEDWEQDLLIVSSDQCELFPSVADDSHCVPQKENCKDSSSISKNDNAVLQVQQPVSSVACSKKSPTKTACSSTFTESTQTSSINLLPDTLDKIPKPAVGEIVRDHLYSDDLERRNNVNNYVNHRKLSNKNQQTTDSQKGDVYVRNLENKLEKFERNEISKWRRQDLKEDWESSLLDIDDFNSQHFQEELNEQVVPIKEFTTVEKKENNHSFQKVWPNNRDKFYVENFWETSLLDVNDIVAQEIEKKDVERIKNVICPGTEKEITDRSDRGCIEEDRDLISRQYLPPPPPFVDEVLISEAKQSLEVNYVHENESVQYKTETMESRTPKNKLTNEIMTADNLDDLLQEETGLKEMVKDVEVSESEESYLPLSENTPSGIPTNSDIDESVGDANIDFCVHSQESSVEEAILKRNMYIGHSSIEPVTAFQNNQDINDIYPSDQDSCSSCDINENKEPMQYFHQSPYAHIGEKFGWRTRDDVYTNYVNTPTGTFKCTCPPAFVKFWIWRSCVCNCGEQPVLCDIRNGQEFGMHYTYTGMSQDIKDKRVPYKPRGILGVTFPPPPPLPRTAAVDKMFDSDCIGSSASIKSETKADGTQSNTPTVTTMSGAYPSSTANHVAPPGFYPQPSFSIPPPPHILYSSPQECYLRYCSPYTFHSPPEGYEQKCKASQDKNIGTSAKETNEQDIHNCESKEKIKMPLKKHPILTDKIAGDSHCKSYNVLQKMNVDDVTSTTSAQHIPKKTIQPGRKLFHGIRFPTLSPTRNPSVQKTPTEDMVTRKILKKFTVGSGENSLLDSPKLVDYNLSETDDSEEEKAKLVEEEVTVFPYDNSQDGNESSGDKRKYELEDGELPDDDEDYLTNKKRWGQLSPSFCLTKANEDKPVPRYVPPHKRLSWPQVKDKNLSGVQVKDTNKRVVMYGDRRKSLGSTNVNSNTHSKSDHSMLKQTTPFWSSNSANTSPLFGFNEPTCLYPAAYFIDNPEQANAPTSHGYGEVHKARTEKRLQKSALSSDIQWHLKSEETSKKIGWQQGSPSDVLASPRQRFLQRSRLIESDSDSGSSDWQSEWKSRFKNRCRMYQETFIDSHCHLDFLFNRQGFRGSWSKYKAINEETFPDNFEGCVAVFCFPGSFRSEGLWKDVALENGVWLAFGCHPKHATEFTARAEEGLRRCLQNEKVVALGEIGLDYSGIFMQHEAVQKIVFIKQIQIALELNKPLVIHCRQAEEDCLNILERMVPRNYRIHCHCFTGNYESAKKWMNLFPNLYIGLTPLVTFRTAEPTHEVARFIPLDRLLLETDAPYFIPRKIPKDEMQFSHPGMAVTVAEDVAWYKQCSVSEVLKACRRNTQNMYGI